jgi:hypothetical protein
MSNLNHFVIELERIIKAWPERAVWAISQISMYTQMDAKQVAKWISAAMGKELDIQDRLTLDEGEQVLETLREISEKGDYLPSFTESQTKSSSSFAIMRSKLAPLLQAKNWRQAYKNLSYYMSQNSRSLPVNDRIEGSAECLRTGVKAEISTGELASWLQAGIDASLEDKTARGVDDAVDLLDAYGNIFVDDKNNNFLEEIFKKIKIVAEQHKKEEVVEKCRLELLAKAPE